MRVNEIERYPSDSDSDDTQSHREKYERVPNLKPVPQNPQYGYTFNQLKGSDLLNLTGTDMTLELYHIKNNLARYIGFLNFRRTSSRGLRNPIQVSNVYLEKEFRKWGVGLMMYGIILGLGYTIVADASQTPQARKLWVRLWNQPGVIVRGMIDVLSSYVDPDEDNDWNNEAKRIKSQLKRIKAQPLQDFNRRRSQYGDDWERYSFEVQPKPDGSELTGPGISIYKSNSYYDDYDSVGLYATLAS